MHASKPDPQDRPIGFWIKAVDRALDRAIDRLHEDTGFTRRRWQVMNAVAARARGTAEAIAADLRPMLSLEEVGAELEAMEASALLETTPQGVRLTDAGHGMRTTLSVRQEELRRRAVRGVEAADYATTIATLARVLDNLADR